MTALRRQKIVETIYGNAPANLFMAIDFENIEDAKTAFLMDEYLQLFPLRNKVFDTFEMYLAEDGTI